MPTQCLRRHIYPSTFIFSAGNGHLKNNIFKYDAELKIIKLPLHSVLVGVLPIADQGS